MYTDIESKINAMKTSLHAELQKVNAIDEYDCVIDIKLFEQVVKSTLEELKNLESLVVDKNGNATDRYGTNIWMNAISELQNMLKYQSWNPQQDKINSLQDMAESIINRESAFRKTIKDAWERIFGKKLDQGTEKLR